MNNRKEDLTQDCCNKALQWGERSGSTLNTAKIAENL